MTLATQVLAVNDDLPIRTHLPVHSGKVRSVYWLTEQDSARLIREKNYPVPADTPLGAGAYSQWHLRLASPGLRVRGYTLVLFYP